MRLPPIARLQPTATLQRIFNAMSPSTLSRLLHRFGLGALTLVIIVGASPALSQDKSNKRRKPKTKPAGPVVKDAKNTSSGLPEPTRDPALAQYGIYEKTAPRADESEPVVTQLPLELRKGTRIALIGNGLLERSQDFGQLEAMIQTAFPGKKLTIRHLAWAGDEIDVQPRPDNFADTFQHLKHERADVIFAAYGFNESFAGEAGLEAFRERLTRFVSELKSKAFNGEGAARIVLVSPTANENLPGVAAADRNNSAIKQYTDVMRDVADQQGVGFADVFGPTSKAFESMGDDYTINGVHLNRDGDRLFSEELFGAVFDAAAPEVTEELTDAIADKNRQFFRRFRPLNTFYYTGGRSKTYGYLDFLPAMRNFEMMAANRDQRIWDLAEGKTVEGPVDDGNLPPMPETKQSRGANRWMTAEDELKAFKVDPRFEVNLFAGEEQFPDIANPIQMRWDARGRLWVSCSTTYPHVYPGKEPNDKLVILEDTDGDGRADQSTVFADDLHVPLSFEFGDGGVYVSEQPNLTFLKDVDGDDRADVHEIVLSGFGTEDSHHSLHDFTWSPDGDLVFRESIFHHSQVETPYGPVRQQNSGWFRFQPRTKRLLSFGTYHSTNPWGVSFDRWGQHMASHPVYAEAFHSVDPPYPLQHPKPTGLQAYSGVCGHHIVDFPTFPEDTQGGFIKVRYKPTNRVEFHRWKEGEFGYEEEYVGDLLFSSNLSFIPVDLQWGPRGALYVCDWYNPIKGHAQYSLRDPRRDRDSGRIWRITAKDAPLLEPPQIDGASVEALLELLKRPEYRIRDWAKRELCTRDRDRVLVALNQWVKGLDASSPDYRHHQLEAVWTYRSLGLVGLPEAVNPAFGNGSKRGGGPDVRLRGDSEEASSVKIGVSTLRSLLGCDDHHARAAATKQLRYWYPHMDDAVKLLRRSANDPNGVVRMQAVISASYFGTRPALKAILDVFNHPTGGHLQYAISCALGSRTIRPLWEDDDRWGIAARLKEAAQESKIKEPTPSAPQSQFDSQDGVKVVNISCIPEKMLFSVTQIQAEPGQPLKIVFTNPDATDHNLVLVKPGALAEVGTAANEMAKDPRNAKSDFIPRDKGDLILQASPMIGPTRSSLVHVMRFNAPTEPGLYPYVCTFPGHWVVMNGMLVVAPDAESGQRMLAESRPSVVKQWTLDDFSAADLSSRQEDTVTKTRGMMAFVKANCSQCHMVAGHGVNLGPDLAESTKKLRGMELLTQIINPSSKIHEKYQMYRFLLQDGRIVTGVIMQEDDSTYGIATNLLTPNSLTTVRKRDVEVQSASKNSPMPNGLLDALTKDEILDLMVYLEAGGYQLPPHIDHHHQHGNSSKAE